MGSIAMYLNRWTPYFCLENDIPSIVPVWVCLPYLSLHCWDDDIVINIGNTLLKYIDWVEPKDGLQVYA